MALQGWYLTVMVIGGFAPRGLDQDAGVSALGEEKTWRTVCPQAWLQCETRICLHLFLLKIFLFLRSPRWLHDPPASASCMLGITGECHYALVSPWLTADHHQSTVGQVVQ